MRTGVIVLAFMVALLACAAAAYWAWQEVGRVEISWHGWMALGLGAVLTFLVGAGLITLMFFSARRGYDERAHEADRTRADHWRRDED